MIFFKVKIRILKNLTVLNSTRCIRPLLYNCVDYRFSRRNVSLDTPREIKTVTRFVTDWLSKFIGLTNLIDVIASMRLVNKKSLRTQSLFINKSNRWHYHYYRYYHLMKTAKIVSKCSFCWSRFKCEAFLK